MSNFKLSKRSLERLNGVHPNLVRVVKRALELSTQDFSVNEGLRSIERQTQLVNKGASQTMNSKHLKQKDGYGHAVDLIPWGDFDGDGASEVSWDLRHYYPIADAMRQAANELGVNIRWGGAWCVLNHVAHQSDVLVADYVAARRKLCKKAFIDAPHFELYQA